MDWQQTARVIAVLERIADDLDFLCGKGAAPTGHEVGYSLNHLLSGIVVELQQIRKEVGRI